MQHFCAFWASLHPPAVHSAFEKDFRAELCRMSAVSHDKNVEHEQNSRSLIVKCKLYGLCHCSLSLQCLEACCLKLITLVAHTRACKMLGSFQPCVCMELMQPPACVELVQPLFFGWCSCMFAWLDLAHVLPDS
eukprot:scaffold48958_cov22-Tisochrysis_lutea.AAC.1